jgi:cytochrome bd-type quinol oxidase subunit 1
MDFSGTLILTVSSWMEEPFGILVGLGIKGIAAGLKYVQ